MAGLRQIFLRRARIRSGIAVWVGFALLFGCGIASAGGPVAVLYAGSLVNMMERDVGPAFDRASGYHFEGYAGGSKMLANEIRGRLRRADVFVSAAPRVNARLMGPGPRSWLNWYLTFAQSPLVIGYNPASRFAAAFRTQPWYRVLQSKGIRLGRTDPKLDPKGSLTVTLLRRAEKYYEIPGLARRVLGAPENPAQVLPESALIGRLQSGEIDAGFFYSTETSAARIPAIALPAAITPKAIYTIAILNNAPDRHGALAFVKFLLGPQGRGLMQKNGLTLLRPTISGNGEALPPQIRKLWRTVGRGDEATAGSPRAAAPQGPARGHVRARRR